MSNQTLEKPCKYGCNFIVVWKGKTGEPGSTGFFEKGSTIEHKFDRCREIKAKGIKQILPEQSSKQQQPLPKEQTTLPIKEDTSITMGSLFNMGLGTKNEVRELKKQVETLLELVDSLSQQMSLVIKQTGYPKPEPTIPVQVKEEDKQAFEATQQKIKEELEQDKKEEEKRVVDGDKRWFEISEKYVCVSCKNVFHNGWENRAGTKLCDECKTESEASIEAMKYSEQRDEFIGGDDISF